MRNIRSKHHILKKIVIILLIIFIFSIILSNKIYGQYSNGLDIQVMVIGGDTKTTLGQLNKYYNYQGSELQIDEKAKWDTTITYLPDENNIKIGDETEAPPFRKNYINEEVLTKLGYYEYKNSSDFNEDNQTWNAVLIVTTGRDGILGSSPDEPNMPMSTTIFHIEEVYSGDKLEEGRNLEIDSKKANLPSTNRADAVEEAADEAVNKGKTLLNIATGGLKNLLDNLVYNALDLLLDLFRVIPDVLQMLTNMVQTISDDTVGYITYPKNDIKPGDNRYKYVKVGDYNDNGNTYKTIEISEKGFNKDTEIPVIPVDLYTIAAGNVEILDTNFLVPGSIHDGDQSSPWMVIRNFAVNIIRVTFFVSAAVLMTTLIWNGVSIAISSITPQKRKDHIEGIHRFFISLIMLVGTIVIIELGVYAVDMVLPEINNLYSEDNVEPEDNVELPIRVKVKEAEYSFSTNFTGFVRYKTDIKGKEFLQERLLYILVYFILAELNFITVILMFIRMIAILVLDVIGPIIAALHVIDLDGNSRFKYKDWVNWYIGLSAVQVIFALACRIILETQFG